MDHHTHKGIRGRSSPSSPPRYASARNSEKSSGVVSCEGCSGSLVESAPVVRRVTSSNPALETTYTDHGQVFPSWIRVGFVKEECFQFGVKELWKDSKRRDFREFVVWIASQDFLWILMLCILRLPFGHYALHLNTSFYIILRLPFRQLFIASQSCVAYTSELHQTSALHTLTHSILTVPFRHSCVAFEECM